MGEFELTIKMLPDGRVMVTGPVSNKGVCYMLLEMARDAIQELHAKSATSNLVVPNGGLSVVKKGLPQA